MKSDGLELQIDGETHDVLKIVQGSIGNDTVRMGERGQCRYCGTEDQTRFRSVAHAVPEAFGNKWVVSLDECDDCNAIFSKYEDALAKTVGPVLTVGGTLGKGNSVRQTAAQRGLRLSNIFERQKAVAGSRCRWRANSAIIWRSTRLPGP